MLDLGRQFRQRQRAWMEELRRHLYTPVLEAAVEGFTTFDRLRPETAEEPDVPPLRGGRGMGCMLGIRVVPHGYYPA